MLAEYKIKSNKEKIVSLLRRTDRNGIENVIQYLNESGFFEAPSSIDRHHNWRGGLAEHSLGVYRIASELNNELPKESLIIAGLLHDICKASKLYYDSKGNVHHRNTYIKGHGYRSIKLLEKCGLRLTEDERLAIRWHMGGHHAHGDEIDDVSRAKQNELWKAIYKADRLDASGKWNSYYY